MFWVSLTLSLFLAIYQPGIHALPLAASALAQPAQGSTNATEIQALTVIANTLFQSQAQQIAYGWLLNIDPCGYQSCRPRVQPSCSWTGLTCTNWHVTGILLDPSRVTVPNVPAQLKGTISPYIVLLQQLQSLQLGDQGYASAAIQVSCVQSWPSNAVAGACKCFTVQQRPPIRCDSSRTPHGLTGR